MSSTRVARRLTTVTAGEESLHKYSEVYSPSAMSVRVSKSRRPRSCGRMAGRR